MNNNENRTSFKLIYSACIILASWMLIQGSPNWLQSIGLNFEDFFNIELSTASVSQYRTNIVAANNNLGRPPTQAEIKFQYPEKMRVDSTMPAKMSTLLKEEVQDFDEKGTGFKSVLKPINSLADDINVDLKSSGFDIDGITSAKAGDKYPVQFNWTLHPKNEGNHVLLLNLQSIIRDARFDSKSIGKTEVAINNTYAHLDEGSTLVLPIEVVGKWGISSRYTDVIGWVFALLGFTLAWDPITKYIAKFSLKEQRGDAREKEKKKTAEKKQK